MRRLVILAIGLIVLDALTTAYGVQHGVTEGNPVTARTIALAGLWGGLVVVSLVKAGAVGGIAMVRVRAGRETDLNARTVQGLATYTAIVLASIYGLFVLNNLIRIARA